MKVDELDGFADDLKRLQRQVAYMLSNWKRLELPDDVVDPGVAFHLSAIDLSFTRARNALAHVITCIEIPKEEPHV